MRRLLLTVCLSLGVIWSACAMAESIGVVDMRQVFQSSTKIKNINVQLNKQFAPQKNKIVVMGKSLQADIKKLQKNQSIMDKKSLDSLRGKITNQGQQLRAAQAKFQQALFAAQNKAMSGFMTKLTGIVKTIAKKKKLDVVFPKNSVLYVKDSMNITPNVASALDLK